MLKLRRFLRADPRIIGLQVAGCVCLLKLAGVFEGSEFHQLNWLFRHRPVEAPDERIVVVGQTEEDIQELGAQTLSDRTLHTLLTEISRQEPRAIGLDFIRDLPEPARGETAAEAEKSLSRLRQLLTQTPNLYVVAKVTGNKAKRVPPPPGVEAERVGDISLPLEEHGVQRRQVLLAKQRDEQGKIETFVNSLALHLAFAYLEEEDADLKITEMPRGWLGQVYFKLGRGSFPLDVTRLGFEILINWRNPPSSFKSVTVTDVLEGNVAPDLFTDRVVLLGSMAISKGDQHNTPYLTPKSGDVIYGVELIANVTSQVISAALEGRPNLRLLPDSVEYAVIFLCSLLSAGTVASWHKRKTPPRGILWKVMIVGGGGVLLVALTSYLFFLEGVLIPVFPIALAVAGSAVGQGGGLYWQEWRRSVQERERHEKIQKSQDLRDKFSSLRLVYEELLSKIDSSLREFYGNQKVGLELAKEEETFFRESGSDSGLKLIETLESMREDQMQFEGFVTEFDKNKKHFKDFCCSLDQDDFLPILTPVTEFMDLKIEQAKKKLEQSDTSPIIIEKNYDLTIKSIEIYPRSLELVLEKIFNKIISGTACRRLRGRSSLYYQPKIIIKAKNNKEETIITIASCEIMTTIVSSDFFWFHLAHDLIDKLHEGSLEIHSNVEELTKFVIRIPKNFSS